MQARVTQPAARSLDLGRQVDHGAGELQALKEQRPGLVTRRCAREQLDRQRAQRGPCGQGPDIAFAHLAGDGSTFWTTDGTIRVAPLSEGDTYLGWSYAPASWPGLS